MFEVNEKHGSFYLQSKASRCCGVALYGEQGRGRAADASRWGTDAVKRRVGCGGGDCWFAHCGAVATTVALQAPDQ
eukprot:349588-Chlamydomonas_euryale.AAC.8